MKAFINSRKFIITICTCFVICFSLNCNQAKEKKSVSASTSRTESQVKSDNSAAEISKEETKLFSQNLINNSDAETGNGEGWANADELKTIVYGDFGGGPTRDSAGPPNRSDKYFYARTTTDQPVTVFTQKIDINKIAEIIDKARVSYGFGGWFGVANGSSSAGKLKVAFLDKDGKGISTDETAEITEAERPADEVLAERSKSGNLPAGTRRIELTLEFKIFSGHDEKQDNLSFADNVSLILTDKGEK